jgi:tetratricopeptide (TPR) repeat protein
MLKKIFFFIFLSGVAFANPADLEKASEYFAKANELIKQDPHGKLSEILGLLNKSKGILLSETKLSSKDEDALTKICSHLYWLSKFSTTKDLHVTDSDKNTSTTKSTPKIKEEIADLVNVEPSEWEKIKAEKERLFQEELQKTKDFEAKFKHDARTNMLNYLDLQVKVVDVEKALELLSKAESYNSELVKERKELLEKSTSKIKDFTSLMANKDYENIFVALLKIYRSNDLDPKEATVLRMFAMEIKAMVTIKNRLIAECQNCAIPLPRQYGGMSGVVTSINERGISVISDDKERSFLHWNTVSEETIIALGVSTLNERNADDLYIYALANLRQENYDQAYSYFKRLMDLAPENYLRYNDYLSICETGYRLKYAARFEEIFAQVDKLKGQGHSRQALDLLIQFKSDFLNSPLGSSYMERFKLVFNDMARI